MKGNLGRAEDNNKCEWKLSMIYRAIKIIWGFSATEACFTIYVNQRVFLFFTYKNSPNLQY